MSKHHRISDIRFTKNEMLINVDGVLLRVDLKAASSKLKSASEAERNSYVISPSGYGIHWPSIDEDLSIDGLLKQFGSQRVAKQKQA